MDEEESRERKTYQCNLCNRLMCSKQRLMTHLKAKHDIDAEVPPKKYKKYKDDPAIPVPRTTQYRQKINTRSTNVTLANDQILSSSVSTLEFDTPSMGQRDIQDTCTLNLDVHMDENQLEVEQYGASDVLILSKNLSTNTRYARDASNTDVNTCILDADEHVDENQMMEYSVEQELDQNTFSLSVSKEAIDKEVEASDETVLLHYEEECTDDDELSEKSEFSSDTESLLLSSESSFESSESESEDVDDACIENMLEQPTAVMPVLSECEEKYMTFLAYSSRHCLNTEAVNNLIKLFSVHNPQDSDINNATFSKMKSAIGDIQAKIFDFCSKCHSLFPQDEHVTECVLPSCNGLRFKGTKTQQVLKQRKSFFASTALEKQIKDILERKGMWKTMKDYRKKCEDSPGMKDILNGEMYRSLREAGNFLSNENNISLLFNTDGVPLYNSSKVSIWPVYIVINELPPMIRFSRQNMILWGVWQAKGKPTFQTFFRPFIQEMISLKMNGFSLEVEGSKIQCKAILIAGTLDLQAKAMLMEMTHHNGEYGCLSCEMPGIVVAQGKGHARVFLSNNEPFIARTSNGVLECGLEAQEKSKPVKGIKGVSVLHGMEWFDTVNGLVPDYMHGILLGVTKKMLTLILSSSNAPKTFFVGKDIKNIDKFLMDMKPTDLVTRLPRKLEEHLHNLKASELQIWLLYYCIPCLIDFQKHEFLDNLALFVEGVYITLGDNISNTQLDRAKHVLKTFYRQFNELYGANNVTLNIHNAGEHLAEYVHKLGPTWAWSCFPFEDMNGSLLEQMHGTGNVCLQILWTLQAHKRLAVDLDYMSNITFKSFVRNMIKVGRQVQVKKVVSNCKIAGSMKLFNVNDDLKMKIKELLSVAELGKMYKVLRIIKDDQIFFSSDYSRVEKRVSHIVSLQEDSGVTMASVQYYIYYEDNDICLAVVKEIVQDNAQPLLHPTVHHLMCIDPNFDANELSILNVDRIQGKLLYLNGNNKYHCVSKMPNPYGQCS